MKGPLNIKNAVLLHEVFHGLGMVAGAYSGANATTKYKDLVIATKVAKGATLTTAEEDAITYGPPIEDSGGAGTINSHFEEGGFRDTLNSTKYVFPNEIMTGVIDADNFLTTITLGVLQDLGFGVNYNATSVFTDYADAAFVITDPV